MVQNIFGLPLLIDASLYKVGNLEHQILQYEVQVLTAYCMDSCEVIQLSDCVSIKVLNFWGSIRVSVHQQVH